jgi:hypothetical protein
MWVKWKQHIDIVIGNTIFVTCKEASQEGLETVQSRQNFQWRSCYSMARNQSILVSQYFILRGFYYNASASGTFRCLPGGLAEPCQNVSVQVSWVVTKCSNVVGYCRFGGSCQLHFIWRFRQQGAPKRRHNKEDRDLNLHDVETSNLVQWKRWSHSLSVLYVLLLDYYQRSHHNNFGWRNY